MKDTFLIDLVYNAAVLLAFTMLYENFWLKNEMSKSILTKILTGIVLGCIGIILTLNPATLVPGILIDTQTILLSVSGLFFGPIPTILAMIITGTMSISKGGDGMWMGLAAIISSGCISLMWRQFRPSWREKNSYFELLIMGLVVNLILFILSFFLVSGDIKLIQKLPMILIFVPGTALLGVLMLRQAKNHQNNLLINRDNIERRQRELELKDSLALMHTTIEAIRVGILVVDHDGKIITNNARFAEMWNIPEEIISSGSDNKLLEYILEQLVDPHDFTAKVTELYQNPESESLDVIHFKDGRVFERISKPLVLTNTREGRVWSFNDISVRMRAIAMLEESEQKFRNIFENSQEGIFQTRIDGTYVSVNPALARMYGFDNPEELMKSRTDISKDAYSDPTERNNFLRMMEEQGYVKGYEYEVKRKDGEKIWFYEDAHAVKDEHGQIQFFEGFVIDITKRKKADAEVIQKTEELQKLNNEKDKFFSIIAHDLRSPFNSFLGLTQIMAEELSSLTREELQKIAGSMRNSAVNLFRLLENLLQWSRVEQGSLPFDPEIRDLKSDIDEGIAMVLESARNKEIRITYEIQEDLMVYADSNMLRTIIRNLVSNAIKFTPYQGKISLEANVDGNQSTLISVKDTGIGMTPEFIENLFLLDGKTNRKGTHGEPSSGLGLILCKEFVTRHGGNIWVQSTEGKGTTFYFTFPNLLVPETV
jgi:PAS domain S-box-containing protein